METVKINHEWVREFLIISEEVVNSPIKIDKTTVHPSLIEITQNFNGISDDDYNNIHSRIKFSEIDRQFLEQRKWRMMRMQVLFASQPRLEKICKNWQNDFVDSGFATYNFPEQFNESFESEEDDLKYLINFCGYNLTRLNLYNYPVSRMMQLIKCNCIKLRELVLRFEEMESTDFDNVFLSMSYLDELIIHWPLKDSSLPMTLIKSLEQVRGTLKTLTVSCENERYDSSILSPETEALMIVICHMENLESAIIQLDYGFTDKSFMNLTKNAKNLKSLSIRSSNITDKGLITLNKLNQLEHFSLDLNETNMENRFITDKSIRCLFNTNLKYLTISNCTQVTDTSILEIVKNLPYLQSLNIMNTKATFGVLEEIAQMTENCEISLIIYVSFKIHEYRHTINFHPALMIVSSC